MAVGGVCGGATPRPRIDDADDALTIHNSDRSTDVSLIAAGDMLRHTRKLVSLMKDDSVVSIMLY